MTAKTKQTTRHEGRVQFWWNGYGGISTVDRVNAKDVLILCYPKDVPPGIKTLPPGARVEFDLVQRPGNPKAVNVVVI